MLVQEKGSNDLQMYATNISNDIAALNNGHSLWQSTQVSTQHADSRNKSIQRSNMLKSSGRADDCDEKQNERILEGKRRQGGEA